MKNLKRILAMALALAIAAVMVLPAYAAEEPGYQYTDPYVIWNYPSSLEGYEEYRVRYMWYSPHEMSWTSTDIHEGTETSHTGAHVMMNLINLNKVEAGPGAGEEGTPYASIPAYCTDGNVYTLPVYNQSLTNEAVAKIWLYKPWLDKLELKVPTTVEEMYEVLKAFKEKDPNGNGEADEIPMSGIGFTNNYAGIGSLAWAFDTHHDLYIEDGKVVYGPAEAKFEEALAYIAKLYAEGLIDVDYLLNDRNGMESKAFADRVGFHYNYQNTKYGTNAEFNDGTKRMEGIPYFTQEGSDSLMCFNKTYEDYTVPSTSICFTTSCEDIKSVLKWFDLTYEEEFNTICCFGEEGVHFDYVDGKPVLKEMDAEALKDYRAHTTINGSPIVTVQQWEAHGASLHEWGYEDTILWTECADRSGILPSGIVLTAEEKEEIADALSQVKTYADTQINKIVIGELSMDEWDATVEKFYDMGLDDVLEVYNAAYQRYLAAQ